MAIFFSLDASTAFSKMLHQSEEKDENKGSDANLPQTFIVLFITFNLPFSLSFLHHNDKIILCTHTKTFFFFVPLHTFSINSTLLIFTTYEQYHHINLHRKLLDLHILHHRFRFHNSTVSISSHLFSLQTTFSYLSLTYSHPASTGSASSTKAPCKLLH